LASHRARDFRIGLQPPSPAMTRAGFVQRESAARWVWTRMGPAERQAERSMPARFDQVAEPPWVRPTAPRGQEMLAHLD